MRARKPWTELSPAYRERLEGHGITRSDYTSGIPLDRARGHAATPEHPERAERDATRYPSYIKARVKPMRVATAEGVKLVVIPRASERSRIATYDNSVKKFLGGGTTTHTRAGGVVTLADFNDAPVYGFIGNSNTLQEVSLLTNEKEIAARYYTGELRYEQIYAHVN